MAIGSGSRRRLLPRLASCAVVALLALSVPASIAASQTSPAESPVDEEESGHVDVVFYAHWLDVVNRAPMNTQSPAALSIPDLNTGYTFPTIVFTSPCEPCHVVMPNNQFTLYTLPDRLRPDNPGRSVDASTQDPTYDVHLGRGPVEFRFWISAHPVPQQNSSSPVGGVANAGVMPAFRAEARWETGRHSDRGDLIAEGTSNIINIIHGPGGDPVYEVVVPMSRQMDVIPRASGTILTTRLHQVNEEFGATSVEFMQSDWRLRSGPSYPWRLIVPVQNPLEAQAPRIWSYDQTLNVRWSVQGAFGSYDVDERSFQLVARTPNGAQEIRFPPFQVERVPTPPGRLLPVEGVWIIPYDALAGSKDWRLELSVSNLQGSYEVVANGEARLVSFEGTNTTPGFEPVALVLALVGVALLGGRRIRQA